MTLSNDRTVKTICLMGASFETGNFGVSILAHGAVACMLAAYPDADVFIMDYCRESDRTEISVGGKTRLVPLVNIRFSKKLYLRNNIALLLCLAVLWQLVPLESFRRLLVKWNPYLRRICEADVVGSIAGGDSFSDIYGMVRLVYVTLPQLLAVMLKKNLVLLPQTIGPFRSRTARMVARFLLRRSAVIFSRDAEGVETARSMISPSQRSKAVFCPDVGFVVDAQEPHEDPLSDIPAAATVVALNVSGLLHIGGYTQNNMFDLRVDYRRLVRDLIDYFIRRQGAYVVLVPHVLGGPEVPESDLAACNGVAAALSPRYGAYLRCASAIQTHTEAKHIIGRCDFAVASRMHACIGALSQNVPAVSIAYSNKFRGVMESIGAGHLVLDPRRSTNEEILDNVARLYEQRNETRQQLQKRMGAIRSAIFETFHGLDAIITSRPAVSRHLVEEPQHKAIAS